MIYHYTSCDALMNMISLKHKSKEIVIWATNVYEMEDRLEMQYGYEFVRSFLNSYEKGKKLPEIKRLSDIMPDIHEILIDTDNQDDFFQPKERTPFVISFTDSCNNQRMWEEYADKHRGVCMAFDENELQRIARKGDETFILSIIYNEENEQTENLLTSFAKYIVDSIKPYYDVAPYFVHDSYRNKIKTEILQYLCPLVAAFIKERDYRWESEVRWLNIVDTNSPSVNRVQINGKARTYVNVTFPISFLKQVYLGRDCQMTSEDRQALYSLNGIKTIYQHNYKQL